MAETLWNRALCTPDDVKAYLPGLEPEVEDNVDDQLIRLINAGSRLIYRFANREFISRDTTGAYGDTSVAATLRVFDVTTEMLDWANDDVYRVLELGDLSDSPTLVTVKDPNGNVIETPAAAAYVELDRDREPDEPIRALWFRPDVTNATELRDGYAAEITGIWGFPSVPEDVRQAAITQAAWPLVADVERFSRTFNGDANRVEIPRALCDVSREFLKRLRVTGVG